jgi:Zn finger protein HypA/HybF involved in hydrogenase expression
MKWKLTKKSNYYQPFLTNIDNSVQCIVCIDSKEVLTDKNIWISCPKCNSIDLNKNKELE